ncbi:MAG: DUF839 domain-containing protein [Nitriliruptorales bacterium]|nr:DUF839 domain-containing protein [Nitriliruptorales bacterium]
MARAAEAKPYGKNPDLQAPNNGGYGPLQPDPAGVLALPAGFSYIRFGETGEPLTDGTPTPAAHDGMAAFPGPDSDTVRLVRNHERGFATPFATPAYDATAGGGTTNLVFDIRRGELVAHHPSIAGTIRNCAGGPTPWGSWLTCEETFDVGSQPHGYIFEVPSTATGAVEPVPLTDMGRFVHEAVAVDPKTGIIYETEDRGSSGFYRFLPNQPGELAAGGQLQMLAIRGNPGYDTRTGQTVGDILHVEWVDIDEPNPTGPGADTLDVFNQGRAQGGAAFARLEGAWHGNGSVFINATSGGDASLGQVWEYKPTGRAGGQLILMFESPSQDLLQAPDNICVSPGGSLVVCEDGGDTDFIRGVTRKGQIFDFGRNDLNGSEFAGATFSPDGSTLFINIQSPGITFAITGPFDRGAL